MDLYRVKPAVLRGVGPLVDRLERGGVAPDVLTLIAVPVAAISGMAVIVSPAQPLVLLVVPAACAVRLVLNLLDGALARRTGAIHPRGEFYNELGDRLGDVLMLAPRRLRARGACTDRADGGHDGAAGELRRGGDEGCRWHANVSGDPVQAGPHRAASITAIAVILVGPAAWAPFGPLLLVGTTLTLVERIIVALRELR